MRPHGFVSSMVLELLKLATNSNCHNFIPSFQSICAPVCMCVAVDKCRCRYANMCGGQKEHLIPRAGVLFFFFRMPAFNVSAVV